MSLVNEEQRFRVAVGESRIAVNIIAEHFRHLGYSVMLPPHSMRPTYDERKGHGDKWDIAVLSGRRWWKYEVKGRQLSFSSAKDFPYQTVFIDRCEKVDRSNIDGYLMLNSAHTHLCLIPSTTRGAWVRARDIYDTVKHYDLSVYECPVSLARFRTIMFEVIAKQEIA